MSLALDIPEKAVDCLFATTTLSGLRPRYRVLYGGRGSAKSWSIARCLVAKAHAEKHLILCAREYQSSIADSVHALLSAQITAMGLDRWFDVKDHEIVSRVTGSRFIFKGLRRNIQEIKSTEGITICWVEEAQAVSEMSWKILIPTIRTPGSEIWISYNPDQEDDATHKRFAVKPPPSAIVVRMNWVDNPWFPEELELERIFDLENDPDAYDWIWGGECRHISEATIFRGRYEVRAFETPPVNEIDHKRFFYGADFGFANDPSTLLRCFIKDRNLYIDYEAYGLHVEIDDMPAMYAGGIANKNGAVYPGIPEARNWPIKADAARPETISYLRGQGFAIAAAEKWQGCVEDGIAHLKGFKKIIIHERCKHMAQEARLYSYKVDPRNNDILPVVVDKHNHCWDAIRYALDGYILRAGALGTWQRLAQGMQ